MKEDMAYLWTVNDMVQRKLKKKCPTVLLGYVKGTSQTG